MAETYRERQDAHIGTLWHHGLLWWVFVIHNSVNFWWQHCEHEQARKVSTMNEMFRHYTSRSNTLYTCKKAHSKKCCTHTYIHTYIGKRTYVCTYIHAYTHTFIRTFTQIWGAVCNIHTFVDRSNFCDRRYFSWTKLTVVDKSKTEVTFVKSKFCPDKSNLCQAKVTFVG